MICLPSPHNDPKVHSASPLCFQFHVARSRRTSPSVSLELCVVQSNVHIWTLSNWAPQLFKGEPWFIHAVNISLSNVHSNLTTFPSPNSMLILLLSQCRILLQRLFTQYITLHTQFKKQTFCMRHLTAMDGQHAVIGLCVFPFHLFGVTALS